MTQSVDMDATTQIPLNVDTLSEGATQRRVREETAMYRGKVQELDAKYDRAHIALDRIFVMRIMAIAADPFTQFISDDGPDSVNTEPPL